MGPYKIIFLNNKALFHFHDYGRKGIQVKFWNCDGTQYLTIKKKLPGKLVEGEKTSLHTKPTWPWPRMAGNVSIPYETVQDTPFLKYLSQGAKIYSRELTYPILGKGNHLQIFEIAFGHVSCQEGKIFHLNRKFIRLLWRLHGWGVHVFWPIPTPWPLSQSHQSHLLMPPAHKELVSVQPSGIKQYPTIHGRLWVSNSKTCHKCV